jgi:FKBP-type peptidyl-prolyl cis-trans isomerase SlpA
MVMGDGSLTPNFEACLLGLKKGDKKAFTLEANDAFGEPNPNNMHYMDRSRFGSDLSIEEGMILAFAQPDGSEIPGIIRSVAGDSVTVDFNHPLAGQTVVFDVEIVDVKSGASAQGEK